MAKNKPKTQYRRGDTLPYASAPLSQDYSTFAGPPPQEEVPWRWRDAGNKVYGASYFSNPNYPSEGMYQGGPQTPMAKPQPVAPAAQPNVAMSTPGESMQAGDWVWDDAGNQVPRQWSKLGGSYPELAAAGSAIKPEDMRQMLLQRLRNNVAPRR